jgi:L-aspartate oxidase
MSDSPTYDVLIIGSGAAGLSLALSLADRRQVAVISKADSHIGSTQWAQGGIAAVVDIEDSTQQHLKDTLTAGAGLCQYDAARFTVERGKEAIEWLLKQKVNFSKTAEQRFHLTQEGGHSARRILHAADATGSAISVALLEQAHAHPNIHLLPNRLVIDVIVGQKFHLSEQGAVGAYVLNTETGHVETFKAQATVLATGGASKVYLYTSNPDGSTGDGIAMAWRAGARVANMEFNQFHPTCLYHPKAKTFLISEAVRGEGGRLLLPNGEPFMHRFDERQELAPRDIVARAIDFEMKRLGAECLYLDISHKPAAFIESHFPTIFQRCLSYGIDIRQTPIPVVPAAHYTCGGVLTDHHGRTDVPNLFAIGETAYTGLHGANRLASNSLLECIVFARSCAQYLLENPPTRQALSQSIPPWDESQVTDSDEDIVVAHNWEELRRFMWDYVGIVRTDKRLLRAKHRIDLLKNEINEFYSNYKVTPDLLELRNLVEVAELIVRCAMLRKESRGLHYSLSHPNPLPKATDTLLTPTFLSEL